ncbi:hypothetical protein J7M02_00755 [Candidatus Aerophobetes bacterium]|nr:hypothetical protein [Candidatus Aerophobetes bacterium]
MKSFAIPKGVCNAREKVDKVRAIKAHEKAERPYLLLYNDRERRKNYEGEKREDR